MSPEIGRFILVIGIVMVVVGGLAVLGIKLPFGRLPGDIAIEGERGGIYIPDRDDDRHLDRAHDSREPLLPPLNRGVRKAAVHRSAAYYDPRWCR